MLHTTQNIIKNVSKPTFLRDETEAFLAFMLIISRLRLFQNII